MKSVERCTQTALEKNNKMKSKLKFNNSIKIIKVPVVQN